MGDQLSGVHTSWEPEGAVEVRDAATLPLRDPMAADQAKALIALEKPPTKLVPVLRGGRAVPESERQSDRIRGFPSL